MATDLENSGNLKNCQNLSETQENLNLKENVEYVAQSSVKMCYRKIFFLELRGEKFENALEISRKTQGIQFLKNVATLYQVRIFAELEANSIVKILQRVVQSQMKSFTVNYHITVS